MEARPKSLKLRRIGFTNQNDILTFETEGFLRKKPQRQSKTRARIVGTPKSVPHKLSRAQSRNLVERYADEIPLMDYDIDELVDKMTGQRRLIGHRRITESRLEDIEDV